MGEANDGVITRCYTVKFVRRSKHPAERLWRAITLPEEIEGWMSYPAQIDLRPGGDWRVDFSSTGEGELDGVIVRVETGRRLTYVWGWSVIEWLIEDTPETGGCTYTFVQNGLADRGEDEEGLPAGWHDFLDNLDVHLEGRAQGREQRKARWLALKPRYRDQLDRVVRS